MSLWWKIFIFLALVSQLSCVTQPARGPSEAGQIRDSAEENGSLIEIYPLPDPAVRVMLDKALEYEKQGKLDWALKQTERALVLEPGSPVILQYMAELKLDKGRWGEALNLAHQSWSKGPKVGALCSRNWQTIARSAEHLNDHQWQQAAQQAIHQCQIKAKPRL